MVNIGDLLGQLGQGIQQGAGAVGQGVQQGVGGLGAIMGNPQTMDLAKLATATQNPAFAQSMYNDQLLKKAEDEKKKLEQYKLAETLANLSKAGYSVPEQSLINLGGQSVPLVKKPFVSSKPPRPASPGMRWAESISYDEYGKPKSSFKEEVVSAKSTDKSKPLFEVMSESNKSQVEGMANVGTQIDNVKSIVQGLKPGYNEGVWRKMRLSSEFLRDEELQKLSTAYGLLTATLLKQFQGSRPSDFDYKMWEIITGKAAVTPGNMLASLDYAKNYSKQDKQAKLKLWSKGYGRPIAEFEELVNSGGAGSPDPITATHPKTGEKLMSVDGGQTWQPVK